jgi:hypothetical protein
MLVIVVFTPIHGWFRMENIRKFPKKWIDNWGCPQDGNLHGRMGGSRETNTKRSENMG